MIVTWLIAMVVCLMRLDIDPNSLMKVANNKFQGKKVILLHNMKAKGNN